MEYGNKILEEQIMEAEVHINDSTNTYLAEVNEYGEFRTIDPVRNAINDGNCFDFAHYATAIAINGYVDIYIDNDATKEKKYKVKYINVQTEGDIILTSYKNPTVSAEGTTVPTYNFVSYSTTAFPVAVKHTPTVTTAGTQVAPAFRVIVSDTTPRTSAISERGDEYSRYFNTDNSYLIRIQNVSGAELAKVSIYGRLIIDGDI